MKICTAEGCEAKYAAKGYCQKHYKQMQRYGYVYDTRRSDVPWKTNTSGVKGVSFYSPANRWEAYVHYNGRKKRIGYYDSLEEATAAREAAENAKYGER